ncbi:MAG: N-acetyltransferase [Candidatus Omnitrophota bacterium]|nr:N-acetyltransferase [Candidatus Omnitrophota bacterium]
MLERIRKARLEDVKQIHSLINFYANQDQMMPRSLNELYENIRDFWVYEEDAKIFGCCALHVVGWEDLAEIKSLAVELSKIKKGIGRQFIMALLNEAREMGVKKVFALTYCPDFFKKMGFAEVEKTQFPHKIWAECCNCPKFPDCQEVALIREV